MQRNENAKSKCDGNCMNCVYSDCILTDLEARQMEIDFSTYEEPAKKVSKWHEEHREQQLVYYREYYEKHKEKIKKSCRENRRTYYQKNKKRERQRAHEYYMKNREKVLARLKAKTDEKRRLSGLVNDTDIVTNG